MINKIKNFLTNLKGKPPVLETREVSTPPIREIPLRSLSSAGQVKTMEATQKSPFGDLVSQTSSLIDQTFNLEGIKSQMKSFVKGMDLPGVEPGKPGLKVRSSEPARPMPGSEYQQSAKLAMDSLVCPYCASKNFVKRGWRKKRMENVQLLMCNDCHKTFTPQSVKGKHYPLATIFDAISLYNLGYSLEESCRRVNEKRAPISGSSFDVGSVDPAPDTRRDTIPLINNSVKETNMAEGGGHDPQPLRADACIKRSPTLSDSPSSHETSIASSAGISPATLSSWISEFKDNLPFLRMRDFATAKYKPSDMIITATLAHRQLYRFRFHRAKCQMLMQENWHHRTFTPLVEFLEMVPGECPHQYFQRPGAEVEGGVEARSHGDSSQKGGNNGIGSGTTGMAGAICRASEAPLAFSKTAMIVRGKTNYATKLAAFVLQGAKERKNRHEILQKFMLYNDSVTVATEVPVYLTRDDLEHMKTQLGFQIYNSKVKMQKLKVQVKSQNYENSNLSSATDVSRSFDGASLPKAEATIAEADIAEVASSNDLPKLITGHIDVLQIRNGQIHLLDFKPNAEKERPIEQLTLYAMALSRLTGLRLFEFKCAWFDEKDYFEFYPLHVLHKPKKAVRRKKVETDEGTYLVNKNSAKIDSIRPAGQGQKAKPMPAPGR